MTRTTRVIGLCSLSWISVFTGGCESSSRQSSPDLGHESLSKLTALFEQSIQNSPQDAEAHVGLANTLTTIFCFGYSSRKTTIPRARVAVTTALALDENNGAAHTARGVVHLIDWEWRAAAKSFQKGVELHPESAVAHHWYALYLAAMGQREEALPFSERAEKLDPSVGFKTGLGAVLYFARDFDRMAEQMRDTIALAPDFAPGHDWLGMAYVQLEDFKNAIPTYVKAVELSGGMSEIKAGLGHAYGIAGQEADARRILEELLTSSENGYVPPVQVAYVSISVGAFDQAFELLDKAYDEKSWELVFIREEPWMDPVRSDPRFVDLLERMNFPKKPAR